VKIGVYTIAKNEEKNVQPWLKSAADADSITFVDTGSTDETTKTFCALSSSSFRYWQVNLHYVTIDPWRFDTAHNVALSLVPADVDVCIPLHLDERLMPGWRDALEKNWVVGETTKAFYTYVFSHHADGSPELQFMQNRIHARKGYVWRYPDHEGIYPYLIQEKHVMIPELRIEQWQDRTRDHGDGVLQRLLLGLQENPGDQRVLHYLGRELYYKRMYRQAIPYLEQYLANRQNPFPVERAETARILGECWKAVS
jgi:hypothetical protein